MAVVARVAKIGAQLLLTLLLGAHAFMPVCQVSTDSVVMPSAGSGKCYCGGDVMGYCNPDPLDQGLDNKDCHGSGNSSSTVTQKADAHTIAFAPRRLQQMMHR